MPDSDHFFSSHHPTFQVPQLDFCSGFLTRLPLPPCRWVLSGLHITIIVILVKHAKLYSSPGQAFQQLLTSLRIKSQDLSGVILSNQLLFLLTSALSFIHILGTVPHLSTVPQLLKHTPCSSPLWLLAQTSHFFLVLCPWPEPLFKRALQLIILSYLVFLHKKKIIKTWQYVVILYYPPSHIRIYVVFLGEVWKVVGKLILLPSASPHKHLPVMFSGVEFPFIIEWERAWPFPQTSVLIERWVSLRTAISSSFPGPTMWGQGNDVQFCTLQIH